MGSSLISPAIRFSMSKNRVVWKPSQSFDLDTSFSSLWFISLLNLIQASISLADCSNVNTWSTFLKVIWDYVPCESNNKVTYRERLKLGSKIWITRFHLLNLMHLFVAGVGSCLPRLMSIE